jgi:hypothetical protein
MIEGLPQFSPAALAVLDRMPFDPTARGRFELMSGGLMWPDEFPAGASAAGQLVRAQGLYRYLIAYRRALTLGESREEFRSVWEQVTRHAPNWPGLRPERCGERAARRLRAALRGQDKCLAKLLAQPDAGSSNAEPDAVEAQVRS